MTHNAAKILNHNRTSDLRPVALCGVVMGRNAGLLGPSEGRAQGRAIFAPVAAFIGPQWTAIFNGPFTALYGPLNGHNGPLCPRHYGRRARVLNRTAAAPVVAVLRTAPKVKSGSQVYEGQNMTNDLTRPAKLLWAFLTSRGSMNGRTFQGAPSREEREGQTIGKLWPNDHPNDSEKSPERFRSNDSVNTPERLFTSKRTNMLQVLFIIGCLLVPAFNDWTEKCRKNN